MSNPQPGHLFPVLLTRRFPFTVWPWRALAYAGTTVVVAVALVVPLAIIGSPWLIALDRLDENGFWPLDDVAVLVLVGAALVAGLGPLVARPLAAIERRRLRIIDKRPLTDSRRSNWYTDPSTWRALLYAVVMVTGVPVAYAMFGLLVMLTAVWLSGPLMLSLVDDPVAFGAGGVTTVGQALPYAVVALLILPTLPWVLSALVGGQAVLARALLSGDESELVEVSRSRARLADAFESERRRIERDLHDGAQHRLTSMTLHLGMARLEVPEDSPAAAPLATAHRQAKELMGVLRELVRGIRPQVLTDLGLLAAIRELADSQTIPVTVHGELPGRLPDTIETTAYFVVAEALANVTKHSGATAARVSVGRAGDTLVVEVGDDGRGGADPARGTGLTGLADRVAAVGGRLLLASPTGGPSLVRVELPCRR